MGRRLDRKIDDGCQGGLHLNREIENFNKYVNNLHTQVTKLYTVLEGIIETFMFFYSTEQRSSDGNNSENYKEAKPL